MKTRRENPCLLASILHFFFVLLKKIIWKFFPPVLKKREREREKTFTLTGLLCWKNSLCKQTFAPLHLRAHLLGMGLSPRETPVCEVNWEDAFLLQTHSSSSLLMRVLISLICVCMFKMFLFNTDWKVVLFSFIHVLMFVWICVLELTSLWYILG